MKMEIDDSNLIVKDSLKNFILNEKFNSTTILEEFGSYKYLIDFDYDKNCVIFNFYCRNFQEMYSYAVKDWLKIKYPDLKYQLNVDNSIYKNGEIYSISIYISLDKYSINNELDKDNNSNDILKKQHIEYAEQLSQSLSKFRCDCYNQVIIKSIENIKEKKLPNNLKILINDNNAVYFITDNEKLSVIYGLNFDDKTDNVLSKLFFRELEDAKFGVSGAIDVKYHNYNIPNKISNIENDSKLFNCGYIEFNLYPDSFSRLESKLSLITNFRFYTQYHIQTVKSFLHINMNSKGKELDIKLNNCRIIPSDVYKGLEAKNYFEDKKKKHEDIKLFTNEFKKVQI